MAPKTPVAAAATTALVATHDGVRDTSVSGMLPYAAWHASAQFIERAREHYRLLACLAAQLRNASMVAFGAGQGGFNALALAQNAGELRNTVTLVDTTDRLPAANSGVRTARDHPAVRVRVWDDWLSPERVDEVARTAQLVVIDLETHEGTVERALVQALVTRGFAGVILLDDIRLNPAMSRMWEELGVAVPGVRRMDATEWGHWSGTGVLVCDPGRVDVRLVARQPYAARDRSTGRLL